jgi:hypothetical protein
MSRCVSQAPAASRAQSWRGASWTACLAHRSQHAAWLEGARSWSARAHCDNRRLTPQSRSLHLLCIALGLAQRGEGNGPLCYTMRCCAMLCYAMLCYAMLCYAKEHRVHVTPRGRRLSAPFGRPPPLPPPSASQPQRSPRTRGSTCAVSLRRVVPRICRRVRRHSIA